MTRVLMSSTPTRHRAWLIVGALVLVWFALAEVVCQTWYFIHESKFKKNPLPPPGDELILKLKSFAEQQGAFQIQQSDVPDVAREMLNCSYAKTISWGVGGRVCAVTVVRWDDRSTAAGVETMHNPGICLAGAGWTIGTQTVLGYREYCGAGAEVTEWQVSRPEIQIMAYSAIFRRFRGAPAVGSMKSRSSMRWGAVAAGRRDAPVLMLLAYIQATPEEQKLAREQFEKIMDTAICEPASQLPL